MIKVERKASIDIGSNTTLFLLADADASGKLQIVEESSLVNGIGEDVFKTGALSLETIEKNTDIVNRLVKTAESKGAGDIIIVGTAALRKAKNSVELIDSVKKETGIGIEILSGEQEAMLTYKGFMSGKAAITKPVILIDVGGGSSEFVFAIDRKVEKSFSLDIGAVSLLKKFPDLGDPADLIVAESMRRYTSEFLKDIDGTVKNIYPDLVLSGGTATALAALNKELDSYEGEVIEGAALKRDWIDDILKKFLSLNLEQREKLLHFEPDRASVIIGGTIIVLGIMNHFNFENCKVTHRGIRFGAIVRKLPKKQI